MAVLYQQPHLVPPMKLTVYDQMPATPPLPPPSHLSKMMNQGRSLASKASERASFSVRKRCSSRPIISNPEPVIERIPSTRRRYRPLELSIYAPQNRLSVLPDFDSEAVNFTDDGAIQLPPRALVRAKSQEFEFGRTPSQRTPNKSKSMIEPALLHRRTNTTSTVLSTSRPPSNHDALRSHPVSWIEGSLPGLPPQTQCHHRHPAHAATILTPMQEEFTPSCTPACITIDGTLLEFPSEKPMPQTTSPPHSPAPFQSQIISTAVTVSKTMNVAPFKLASPPPSASAKPQFQPSQFQPSPTLPQHHQNSPSMSSISSTCTKTSNHLSNWLSHQRGPSSSTSISTSTSRSFAEHRRKRSEFYQVRVPKVPSQPTTKTPTSPPTSVRIPFQPTFRTQRQRTRTMSGSSVGSTSTVSTDIMSLDDGPNESVTTMSTAHVGDVRSTSRAKSLTKPIVKELEMVEVDMPFILQGPGVREEAYLKEVAVGVAF